VEEKNQQQCRVMEAPNSATARGLYTNNVVTKNPLEQANLFNKYFSSVFTVDNGSKSVHQPRTVDNIGRDSDV